MDELRVLMVGDLRAREFRGSFDLLRASAEVTSAKDLAEAVSLKTRGEFAPDLIVLAQGYPRQFRAGLVEQLRASIPTAHFVALLGSWCEGEERTGEPLPGVQRIYWHRFAGWWAAQQRVLAEGRCPDWGQPVTAAEDDRQMAASRRETALPHVRRTPSSTIAVAASQCEMTELLCETCRQWGYATVGLNPREHLPRAQVTAVIWDCRDAEDLAELLRLKRHFDEVPVVAVTNFPRWQHRQELADAGVAALLSKPLRIDELRAVLEPLLKPEASEVAAPVGRVA